MSGLSGFGERAAEIFGRHCPIQEIPAGEYAAMRYPRLLPLMRFAVRCYAVEGFGRLMVMRTRAMGLMELTTASFMPNTGVDAPFLLIDMMSMGKKRTVFVEYYDCTAEKLRPPSLDEVAKGYAALPDYAEKPAWYVQERMPCSLIKGSTAEQEAELLQMAYDSVEAYARLAAKAEHKQENLSGLRAFRERMIAEGNPSSGTMERVLGKEGAERFFRTVVMPMNQQD